MKATRKATSPRPAVERLAWTDLKLGDVETPFGRMALSLGLGSGLSVRANDPPGTLWAIADRGPNLKVEVAITRYGLDWLRALASVEGAKIMPRPDVGPTIFELMIDGASMRLIRIIPLCDKRGRAISGLPLPGADMEPVFGMRGESLPPDPSGADTEGIAALSDGTFWVGDEYAPSLLRVGPDGRVLLRLAPRGSGKAMTEAGYPVKSVLPKIASRRRLNRGFEALAVSPDERWLYVAFQSALAHPRKKAHKKNRYGRIWKIEASTGAVVSQFLYPFDAPESFARDCAHGEVERSDLKLCDAVAMGEDTLLLLERICHTAKVYRVVLDDVRATPRRHLQARTRPTLEQLDRDELHARNILLLAKELILSTDDAPEIAADLEGMVLVAPRAAAGERQRLRCRGRRHVLLARSARARDSAACALPRGEAGSL
jgi:hypothetical protein